jgi:nitric oxide dioxygenase
LQKDQAGVAYDLRGMISVPWLAAHTPVSRGTYYVCGSKPFLRAIVGGLLRAGVPAERVRYEFFGPADELFEADAANLAA